MTATYDRRFSRRISARIPVTLRLKNTNPSEGENIYKGQTTDLSLVSIGIEGMSLPPTKSYISLFFELSESNIFELLGYVKERISIVDSPFQRVTLTVDKRTPTPIEFKELLHSIEKTGSSNDRRRVQRRDISPANQKHELRLFDRRNRLKMFEPAFKWQKRLTQWEKEGTYFYLKQTESASATNVIVDGKSVIMMASNNYLGLATHPKVIEASIAATRKYGTGSGAARLLTGTTVLHRQLEMTVAEFKGKEDAIVYSTGYLANLGVLSALVKKEDVIFIDDRVHASLVDGCHYAGAIVRTFHHNDAVSLDRKLASHREILRKIVIVDGVYSMDGDIADLPNIQAVTHRHGALLMVDDAHATGVIGDTGRGSEEYHHNISSIDITVGTFSKALACAGGFVCGNKNLISYLKHFSRPFIFNTSMPPSVCASAIAALDVLKDEPEIVKALWAKGEYLREALKTIGYDVGLSQTPIIPIMIGHERIMNQMMGFMLENGVMVSPIGRPAVKRNSSRLRVNVMATHSRNEIDKTVDLFAVAFKKFGPFEHMSQT